MSAASDLLSNYQHIISGLELIPATGGVFEVQIGDSLIYSKVATGRHAEPGEVLELFTQSFGQGITRYGD